MRHARPHSDAGAQALAECIHRRRHRDLRAAAQIPPHDGECNNKAMKSHFAPLLFPVFAAGVLLAQEHPTMFPPVRGIHEMVGAANNFEVEAGYRILTQGGNAVDAGVASVLAASVTELNGFGIGGEMPVIIKMAGQPPVVISGVGVAPAKATVEFYAKRPPEPWEEAGHMPPVPGQGMLAAI